MVFSEKYKKMLAKYMPRYENAAVSFETRFLVAVGYSSQGR